MKTLVELGCEVWNLKAGDEELFERSVKRNLKPEFWDDEDSLLFVAQCIFPKFRMENGKFLINY